MRPSFRFSIDICGFFVAQLFNCILVFPNSVGAILGNQMSIDLTSFGCPSVQESAGNAAPSVHHFRFGVFEVDCTTNEIRKYGIKIKLHEKPFRLLLVLLERAGQIVTRDELRHALWPADTFVDFNANLKTTLSKLRQAIGDSADNPVFIETVPRHGYRFLVSVDNVEVHAQPIADRFALPTVRIVPADPADQARSLRHLWALRSFVTALALVAATALFLYGLRPRYTSVPALPAAHRVVLLVLPFDNLSGEPTQEYFSDGLTDEMITLLGRQHPEGLAVIARTSAMRYRDTQKPLAEVARELGGVDYALEGSVRRSGNRVAINAQLFRMQDQASLWAETYEREVVDVLAIQHDVAARIAHSLVLKVEPPLAQDSFSTPDPKVYDAYLMGLYEANKRTELGMRKSIDYFCEAIEADPKYAPAFAGLANSYLLSAGWLTMSPTDAYPKAKRAALRALELDENLAEAHTTLAEAEHEYEWKWSDAEREFRRAIELNPNSVIAHKSYAEFLMHAGRGSEAITEILRARDLDPLSLIVNSLVGFVYAGARQYDRAIQEGERVVQLDPSFAPGHYFLGGALLRGGRYDEGIAHYRTAKELTNGASLMSAGLARALAVGGRRREARRELQELQQRSARAYVSPYGLAQVYASLGEKRSALEMLERAAQEHSFEIVFLKIDRSFDGLREDGHFQDLLNRIGSPE